VKYNDSAASAARQQEYARLRTQLADIGWISEGYVQDRGPGAGGPCYPWTRKVKGKTVCVALCETPTSLTTRSAPQSP
jgi:hypothetical protein